MQPTWSFGVQLTVVAGGGAYDTETFDVVMSRTLAAAMAQPRIDQCGSNGSSTGYVSSQSVTSAIWLTVATRAACRAAFVIVLYANTARPTSTNATTSRTMIGK